MRKQREGRNEGVCRGNKREGVYILNVCAGKLKEKERPGSEKE